MERYEQSLTHSPEILDKEDAIIAAERPFVEKIIEASYARAALEEGRAENKDEAEALAALVSEGATSKQHLLLTNKALIESIAIKHASSRFDSRELAQVGFVAFLERLDKYDPERRTTVGQFIYPWVRGAILDYIAINSAVVSITPYGVRKGNAVRRIVTDARPEQALQSDREIKNITSLQDARAYASEMAQNGTLYPPYQLDRVWTGEDDDTQLEEQLQQTRYPEPESAANFDYMVNVLASLGERDREIMYWYISGLNQAEISRKLQVSTANISNRLKDIRAKLQIMVKKEDLVA